MLIQVVSIATVSVCPLPSIERSNAAREKILILLTYTIGTKMLSKNIHTSEAISLEALHAGIQIQLLVYSHITSINEDKTAELFSGQLLQLAGRLGA